MYEYPPLWLRIRAVTFTCIGFTSFLWTILICYYVFCQWDIIRQPEHVVLVLLLLINTITIVILFILLILPFHSWLDAARCMFLLVSHIGVAVAVVHWKHQFQCVTTDLNKKALCGFATSFMVVVCWLIPALIVLYVQGLAFVVYRVRRRGLISEDLTRDKASSAGMDSMPEPPVFGFLNQDLPLPSPTVSTTSKTSARLSKPIRISYY